MIFAVADEAHLWLVTKTTIMTSHTTLKAYDLRKSDRTPIFFSSFFMAILYIKPLIITVLSVSLLEGALLN
jgi:hypothetical protein